MSRESRQYRFARIEAYRMTLARLEGQFTDRAVKLEEKELAVAEQLVKEALSVPLAQIGNRTCSLVEGIRLAALCFLSEYTETMRNLSLNCHSCPNSG